jgi:hypothetical protein
LITGNACAQLLDYPDRFVTNHQPRRNGILASDDVQIRSANRRQRHPNYRFTDTGARLRYVVDPDLVLTVKYVGFHDV